MVRTLRPIACAAAALFLAAVPVIAQTSETVVPNRIVQPVDDSSRVTLRGYVSPLANAANDRGAAPASMPVERLHLILQRSASQEATLRQMIAGMNQPGSPYYHKWLTPTQFGQEFGPSDQDVATVESWLSSHGFSVTGVKPGRQVLEFSGNVSELQSAFGVQIHKYQVNGNMHYATATEPQIPAALSSVVGGFVSLNNFRPKSYAHVLGQATYDPKTHAVQPEWNYGSTSNLNYVISPQDFAVQYDLPNAALNSAYTGVSYDGSGETIAIINDSNINLDLVNQFRTLFGLAANPPTVVLDGNDPGVDGINDPDGPNYDSSEAYIDVEWSGAVAPKANIDLVIAADTSLESGLFLAAEHAVYSDIAPIMSLSFGECEADLGSTNTYINALMEQAAAEGITMMVSAGDSGSAGCDDDNQSFAVDGVAVNGFASTPWDVALGGTDFYYSDWATGGASRSTYWINGTTVTQNPAESLKGYITEQPWNDSQYGDDALNYYNLYGTTTIAGGSGGASSAAVCSGTYSSTTGACSVAATGYPKPSWQTGFGADKVRDLPDVSLFASDGSNYSFYPFCYADGDCQTSGNPIQISGAGGTSFAAPTFAGIMALVEEAQGGVPQGQADFVLYPLAAQFPAVFHGITVGTNAVPCNMSTLVVDEETFSPTDCISVSSPITAADPTYGTSSEGETGTGTTPEYSAAAGYNLATGLGSVDAAQLVADWGKVSFKSTTMTLTPSSTSFTHGTAVTISGSVGGGSGTFSGNVALMTDSTEPSNQGANFGQALVGGQSTFAVGSTGSFTGSVNDLPGGTYNIWGAYSGDGTNAASTSAKTSITVAPENSSVYFNVLNAGTISSGSAAITSGDTSVPYGTQGTLSAEVVPSTFYTICITPTSPPASCNTTTFTPATGTVSFTDNGTAINTAAINAEGDAEFNAPFSIGTHSLSASYAGDNSYNKSSTSSAFTFTVVQDQPDLYAGASNSSASASNTVIGGQATNFYVLVENSADDTLLSSTGGLAVTGVSPPTGTVTMTGLPQGSQTATLVAEVDPGTGSPDGVAEFTIPASATGTLTLGISYSGDKNYSALSSESAQLAIQAPTLLTTTITAQMTGSITPNSSITVTGTVTGQSGHAAPTGLVYVYPDGDASTAFTLVAGSGDSSTFTGTLTSQVLFQGGNIVTLQYAGDKNYNGSSVLLNSGTAISTTGADFSLTAASSIVSASASGTGTTTVYVTPTNGFTGTVGLGCAVQGAPTGVACSLSQTSVALTSSNTARLAPHGLELLLTGGGGVLACVLLLGMPARRRAWRNVLSLVLFACIIGFGAGCGGSSGAGNIGGTGTGTGTTTTTSSPGTVANPSTAVTLTLTTSGAAAGNYTVVITGTSSATSQIHTLGVTAAVQ